jgi:hypothetical protein
MNTGISIAMKKIKQPTLTEEEEREIRLKQFFRISVRIAIRLAKKRRLAKKALAEKS